MSGCLARMVRHGLLGGPLYLCTFLYHLAAMAAGCIFLTSSPAHSFVPCPPASNVTLHQPSPNPSTCHPSTHLPSATTSATHSPPITRSTPSMHHPPHPPNLPPQTHVRRCTTCRPLTRTHLPPATFPAAHRRTSYLPRLTPCPPFTRASHSGCCHATLLPNPSIMLTHPLTHTSNVSRPIFKARLYSAFLRPYADLVPRLNV